MESPSPRAHELGELREIRVEGVTFTHDGREDPAVKDVSFSVPAGSAVALVGASGAGKSTIVDIMLGLYSPSSGRVTANGTDIRTILPEWQQSLGLVPQEVYLLDDDLRANIAFGEPDDQIDETRLAQAIAGAQLEELVASLPEGLETFVGERGVRLSGGQRQRIGIARALYTRPRLLILDEATSALDNETERRISETIHALHGSVTIIIVAHRLSTVRDCDQVVLLDGGEVAAVGGFEELQLVSPDFARMVELGNLK
jgi:ABC-type multidrug transport system fused ATPase/permease subunit